MDIMDMTVGQIVHNICSDLPTALIAISFLLNAEGIVRQYAVNKGYAKTVNACDHIAKFLNFLTDVLPAIFQKHFAKTVPIVLLCVGLSFATGCASAGLNGGCMHINANGTYAGSANGAMQGCICHVGCIGNCPKPDYTALATMETACVNSANNVTATVPITVAVTPTAK